MTKEELLIIFSDILKEKNILKTAGIHEVNHKPHMFTVGPKHVKHAADYHGGVMGEETLQKIKCANSGCNLPYEQHTSDKTLFLQLTRDATKVEVNDELIKIKDSLINNNIAGVAFVDTEEGYKFLN